MVLIFSSLQYGRRKKIEYCIIPSGGILYTPSQKHSQLATLSRGMVELLLKMKETSHMEEIDVMIFIYDLLEMI